MAFIKVPTFGPDDGVIDYGPWAMLDTRSLVLTTKDTRKTLFDGTHGDRIALDAIDQYTSVDPVSGRMTNPVVPYVNALLKAVGDERRVETYWRSRSLVIKTGGAVKAPKVRKPAVRKPAAPKVVSPAPVAVVAPAPSPVVTSPAVVASPGPVIVSAPSGPAFTAEGIPAVGPKTKVSRRRIDGAEYVTYTGRSVITVEARHHDTMTDAHAGCLIGEPASVIITGPSGTSKTLLARAFADSVQLPLIKVDGATIRSADDWFGGLRQDPASGRWEWVWNALGRALIEGTPCVVLLDEANRAETVQALNMALGLLDEMGSVYVAAALTTLHKPKGMLVIVTANKGSEYVATLPFDTAVTQRFGAGGVRLSYLPEKVEVQVLLDVVPGTDPDVAAGFVRMANQQRGLKDDAAQFPSGVGMSTRMLVEAARSMRRSPRLTTRAVLQSTFDAQFEVEDMPALDKILDFHFPLSGNDTLDVDTEAINED
jgi:MoxR-like ATPase